jgi:hypothetical protein
MRHFSAVSHKSEKRLKSYVIPILTHAGKLAEDQR